MDWEALRYLLAVAETGSHAAAARRLGVSQPTVSRRLAGFETQLGSRLFQRAGRALALTEAAAMLVETARRMDDAALTAQRLLAGQDRALRGSVRLSCTEGIGAGWLAAELHALRLAHPELEVELVIDNAAVNLSKREADVALRLRAEPETGTPAPVPWQDALVAQRAGYLSFGLYAAQSYVQTRGRPQSLAALRGHDVVGLKLPSPLPDYAGWLLQQSLQAGAGRPLQTNSLSAYRAAVQAGWGIGALPRLLGDRDPRLTLVLPEAAVPGLAIWIVFHDDLRGNARVRVLVDFLRELIAREAAALRGSTPP